MIQEVNRESLERVLKSEEQRLNQVLDENGEVWGYQRASIGKYAGDGEDAESNINDNISATNRAISQRLQVRIIARLLDIQL